MKVLDIKSIGLASVNKKYEINRATGTLYLSRAYADFKKLIQLSAAKARISPPYSVRIDIATKADIDNAIKPILDGLQAAGVIDDDKNVIELTVKKTPVQRRVDSSLVVYVVSI
jgi:Holliday junction resolvase RusA-like endonuclease